MHSAPVSWRAEWNVPPAATIAFVTARLPLPINPNTTSPPRACSVRPASAETSMGRNANVEAMRTAAPWLVLGAATAVVAVALGAAGLPSPTLFAALLVGLAAALAGRAGHLAVPRLAFVGAQATVGVVLGTYLQSSSLSAVAGSWLPVALVSAGTLVLSLGAGLALARFTAVAGPTGTLGVGAGRGPRVGTMGGAPRAGDRPRALLPLPRGAGR